MVKQVISIHALLAESDILHQPRLYPPSDFYPCSPCGERLLPTPFSICCYIISIHALLAESDLPAWVYPVRSTVNFYPRSPCGERLSHFKTRRGLLAFLSTLSLRRATRAGSAASRQQAYFYPRSPCGERLHYDNYNLHCVEISIHALLAESDPVQRADHIRHCVFLSTLSLRRATDMDNNSGGDNIFLSTLSLRRATVLIADVYMKTHISIHALLAESDAAWAAQRRHCGDFYPRSPCGERLSAGLNACCRPGFLSTLSLRRATVAAIPPLVELVISIHALLAESDSAKMPRSENPR